MCGLVGILSSNMTAKHQTVLEKMLYFDTFRGRDSTGIAAIRSNQATEVLKETVPGYEFLEGPKVDRFLKMNDWCWIGHNRFGTVGKATKRNAHPFMVLDDDDCCLLVGAHNGTLRNKHALPDHEQYGTDSEALFNCIAEEGLEAALKRVEGAWALTYWDHVYDELRIIRNKERTLFYAFSDDTKTLFWASESWMIRVSVMLAGIKLKDDQVWSFSEDTLYRFKLPEKVNADITFTRKGGVEGKSQGFFRPEACGTPNPTRWGERGGTPSGTTSKAQQETTKAAQTPATGRPEVRAQTSVTLISPSGTTNESAGGKQLLTNGGSKKPLSGETNVVVLGDLRTYKGYKGVSLSRKELETQLENGCSWCETEFISPEDKYGWLGYSAPVCHKCLHGTEDTEEEKQAAASLN